MTPVGALVSVGLCVYAVAGVLLGVERPFLLLRHRIPRRKEIDASLSEAL